MPKSETIHTTSEGWTISASRTIAAMAANQVQLAGGDETRAAKRSGTTLAEFRSRLQDQRLPPEPVISPEVLTALRSPMPDMPLALAIEGEGTEADLLRICALAIDLIRKYLPLDYLIGETFYEPPAWIGGRRSELRNAINRAMDAAAAIPASTLIGIYAKARIVAEYGIDEDCGDLSTPIIKSLLTDVGAFDRPKDASQGICKPGVRTQRAKPAFFAETIDDLDRVWSNFTPKVVDRRGTDGVTSNRYLAV